MHREREREREREKLTSNQTLGYPPEVHFYPILKISEDISLHFPDMVKQINMILANA